MYIQFTRLRDDGRPEVSAVKGPHDGKKRELTSTGKLQVPKDVAEKYLELDEWERVDDEGDADEGADAETVADGGEFFAAVPDDEDDETGDAEAEGGGDAAH